MHFGENQLSPSSVGISPLPTAPPAVLHHCRVRPSRRRYAPFSLAMGSSPGFGSAPRYCPPSSDSLSLRLQPLGLNLATQSNSPAHSSIGTPSLGSPKLRLPASARFQTLCTPLPGAFSPFPHGTGPLSVAKGTAPWRVVPPASHGIPRVPWYSGARHAAPRLRLRDCHPLRSAFPDRSARPFASADAPAARLGRPSNPAAASGCRPPSHDGLGSSAFAHHY